MYVQQSSKVSLVLQAMVKSGSAFFSKEAIAVVAWRAYPKSFAMDGYPQYPDNRKIAVILYGAKGMIARGLLVAVGEDLCLTEAGRAVAAAATPIVADPATNRVAAPAPEIQEEEGPRCKICKKVDALIDGICTSNPACQRKRR